MTPRWNHPAARWVVLIALSVVLVLGLELIHMPAALLMGPMVAGVLVAVTLGGLRTPRWSATVSQGIVGTMIAGTLTPSIVDVLAKDWPLFAAIIIVAVTASTMQGWVLGKLKILPGNTAIWGSSPGAATAMTLMSGEFGADMRLVAFMQYCRVIMVTAAAILVTRWLGNGESATDGTGLLSLAQWFPPLPPLGFAATLALAVLGAFAGRALRIPAGAMMLPLMIGAPLHGMGYMPIVLPPWLLSISYALVGWSIGLTFTRAILAHAAFAMPGVLLSILVQIGLCAVLSVILAHMTGINALTAYLATSPGGADSAAIIATSSGGVADVSFVMALQTLRLFAVMALGPFLARTFSSRT